MKITSTNREGAAVRAYLVKGKVAGVDGRTDGFRCFPSGSNDASKSRSFESETEAATFLRANPSWGIRMNPGTGIFYDIEIDGVER